eukprot:scaffold108955_cov19-Tisochrysis_lutea.AAC.1
MAQSTAFDCPALPKLPSCRPGQPRRKRGNAPEHVPPRRALTPVSCQRRACHATYAPIIIALFILCQPGSPCLPLPPVCEAIQGTGADRGGCHAKLIALYQHSYKYKEDLVVNWVGRGTSMCVRHE